MNRKLKKQGIEKPISEGPTQLLNRRIIQNQKTIEVSYDEDKMPSLEDIEEEPVPFLISDFENGTFDQKKTYQQQRQKSIDPLRKSNQNDDQEEYEEREDDQMQFTNKQNMNVLFDQTQEREVFYPKIQDYLPGNKYNKKIPSHLDVLGLNAEEYEQKVSQETKQLEIYLNKLFPVERLKQLEIYDHKVIDKQRSQDQKNELSKKILDLENNRWTVSKLITELKKSYEEQAGQVCKIENLQIDYLNQQQIMEAKDKKIQSIQKVLRDLNEYNTCYLELNNAEKIDQIDLQYKLQYTQEIAILNNKIFELTKDRDFYKSKYSIFQEKYETIFNEAKEAKAIFQEQVKELLNYKKQMLPKLAKMQEDQKNKQNEDMSFQKKNIQVDNFQNKISKLKNKQNLLNQQLLSDDTQSVAGSQQAIPFSQNYMNNPNIYNSPQNINSNNQFSSEGMPQYYQQQQFMNSPQVAQYPFLTINPPDGMNFNPQIGQNQGQNMKNFPSNPNLPQNQGHGQMSPSQTKSPPSEYDQADQSKNKLQNQNFSGIKQPPLSVLPNSFPQESQQEKGNLMIQQLSQQIAASLSDKKGKKAQVQFEDIAILNKPKVEDQPDNQICANKIKKMLKEIQKIQPMILEETKFSPSKRY